MKTGKIAIFISLYGLGLATNTKALAQHERPFSYSNARVVQQDDIGLPRPSSTYIGAGTLSKSAQGLQEQGPQVNPGLPRVNRGAYLGTPGDNLYSAHPILSPAQEHKELLQAAQKQRRRIHRQRHQVQQNEPPKGVLYQPGEILRAGSGACNPYPTSDSRHGAAMYNPQALDYATTPMQVIHRVRSGAQ